MAKTSIHTHAAVARLPGVARLSCKFTGLSNLCWAK